MKVMYVDDCQLSLEAIGWMLDEGDFNLILSQKPIHIEKVHPYLVILDLYMGDRSGLDVCRKIKSNPNTRDIPVVILSSSFDIADKEACFDAGAIDYLEKPVGREALINAINAYVSIGVMVKASKHIQQGLINDTREKAD